MHLLHHLGDGRFDLKPFPGEDKPRYAILSHTWGNVKDEVTFQDVENGTAKDKPGYDKIKFCIDRMVEDNLDYVWVDTCCIDKKHGSELSEAIVSMFRWYEEAVKCYVFLSDVSSRGIDCDQERGWMRAFRACKWFTRGWTLQELIAPREVVFFSKEADLLGNKHELVLEISVITGIKVEILEGKMELFELSYEDRVAWMRSRQTQKEEDRAYSLLGILGVNMAPCYGERYKSAMHRLRKEFKSIQSPFEHTLSAPAKRLGPRKAAQNIRLPDRCKQARRYCRLYEPLVLLHTLGTTMDDYDPVPLPTLGKILHLPPRSARRKFLEDLAYLCDYDVGHDTVVTMALQDKKPRNVLWVASNTSPTKRIINFVEARLVDIRQTSTSFHRDRPQKTKSFITRCIEFAALRAFEDISCVVAAFRRCKDFSEDNCPEEVPDLLEWMSDCANRSTLMGFCRSAYRCQRSRYMETLARLSLQFRQHIGVDADRNPFDQLRQHLTHLGRRFQAANALFSCGVRMTELTGDIDVCPVPIPLGCTLPPADTLTNFKSIIGRMHSDESYLDKYQRALAATDTSRVLFRQFLRNYDLGNTRPFIHAEIQILDLFHTQQHSFIENDRFIACSRPACWSCSAYFTSHPGRYELSSSDQRLCLNWRPPVLEDRHEVEIEKDRRDALDGLTNRSRREVLHRILKGFPVSPDHSAFPGMASKTEVQGQDRQPTMDYAELVAPLRELCGPQKIPPSNGKKVDSPNIASVPQKEKEEEEEEQEEEEEVIFIGRTPCNLRQGSCLLENLEDSNSEGGVELPSCTQNQQAG